MYLNNKSVLVVGLGISGVSTIKALNKLGAKISITDNKREEELKESLDEISNIYLRKYFDTDDIDLNNIELVIKSPGVPANTHIIDKAIRNNIEVITDIELAYRISKSRNIIGITGTNGKTTTTMLMKEIYKNVDKEYYVVGNIGVGILDKIIESKEDDVFIVELSSFQLEHTKIFKPKVSLILNLSPDHIDWHGSYENYIESKFKIFKNQSKEDYIVLNYDDEILRSIKENKNLKAKVIWFSIKEKLEQGIYIEDGFIIIKNEVITIKLMKVNELKIIGNHNLENVLASIGISIGMGINLELVKKALIEFKGIEHRLEYVTTKKGINFYNDSKGTNIAASIKAIESIRRPIILIAGGYNKNSNFDDFIKGFNNKVKALILFGETKEIIKEAALSKGFTEVHLVETMKEAVYLAYELGEENNNVLFSPACASWDMYKNFEERGKDFKEAVYSLEGDIYEDKEEI